MIIALLVMLFTLVLTPFAKAQVVVAPDVSEDATDANSQPKIGADSLGRIYTTFVKPAGGYSQIFVASSADGMRWEAQQVTSARAHARYPTLAVGPDNRVHLAWTQYDNGVGKVYYSYLNKRAWSVPLKVSPGDTYAGVPSLAVDAQGTVHMVWYGIRAGAPAVTTRHGSIYEILYTASRDGRWEPGRVISPGIPDAVNPALVIDTTGQLHSAWYQFDLRNYQVRHALAPTSDGAGRYERVWMPPNTISSGRADSMAVAMAAGPDASVVLVWERRDSDGIHIYFAERRQGWSGQQQVSAPSQNGFNPSVAIDALGRLFVAWDSDGQIYARRREGTWRETAKATRDSKNTHPIIAAIKDKVLVTWTQQTGNETQLRAAVVADVPMGPPRSRFPWGLLVGGLLLVASLLYAATMWTRSRKSRGGRGSARGEARFP